MRAIGQAIMIISRLIAVPLMRLSVKAVANIRSDGDATRTSAWVSGRSRIASTMTRIEVAIATIPKSAGLRSLARTSRLTKSRSRARNFPLIVQILAVAVLCDTLDTIYSLAMYNEPLLGSAGVPAAPGFCRPFGRLGVSACFLPVGICRLMAMLGELLVDERTEPVAENRCGEFQ